MSYKCDVCSKGPQVINKVSHSNIKTKRRQLPNLQRVHALVAGVATHLRVCTRCLRSGKITKAA
ncbi:MAG: 50S ribosomal protein L28 [Deltaproteobacteria bacterium]|nr:50S ribosomal protein L28 [Deltaproteobacteria bacterium]